MTATIEQLAISYVTARDEHRRLKRGRAAIYCAYEVDPTATPPIGFDDLVDDSYIQQGPTGTPCWKTITEEVEGPFGPEPWSSTYRDPPDWCEPCRRRQLIHDQLKPAQRRMAGCMAALTAAVRARRTSP